jgi:hypothetical protein
LGKGKYAPCSAELISTAYQPWNSVFLSHQNSHSRLISRINSLPNRVMVAPPPAADRSEKEEKQYTSRCMHSTNK